MSEISKQELYNWCKISVEELEQHAALKIPFRLVNDSEAMGNVMAGDLVAEIKKANAEGRNLRAIVPCGPKCWYAPFAKQVNEAKISLRNLTVFHMDECLDWEGKLLPAKHPYNFRTFMETFFYGAVLPELNVPDAQRFFPEPRLVERIKEEISKAPIDITLGGWGQDGHIAYNQTRRHPFSKITIDELRNSELRVQENNLDTIIALAHRTFGAAYQFVPPMSVTLGIKECLSAKKIRLYSDTGSWKQTALRVALFSGVTVEYPITLLQEHPDALLTATYDTASHPIAENPDWEFEGVHV